MKLDTAARRQLRTDFAIAINKVSGENVSDTPDYILGDFLLTCLDALNEAVNLRRTHGRVPEDKRFHQTLVTGTGEGASEGQVKP